MSLKFDLSNLEKGLSVFEDKFDTAVRMYMETACLQMQNDARDNAKWTDRTGHARQRLKCSAGRMSFGYRLRLEHGVDYGLWLELAMEKRFAVIQDTIRYTGMFEVMPGFTKLMEKIGDTG